MNYTITGNSNSIELNMTIKGATLDEIKRIVDFVNENSGDSLSQLDKELIEIIRTGALLQAVKHCKDKTGNGLKESKDYCEELRDKHNLRFQG